MKRFVLIAIGFVALVAACTSSSGGHGSESNFVECRADSDCPHGPCVDNRCEGDASTTNGSTGGAAGQAGSTGGIPGSGGLPGVSGGSGSGGTSGAGGLVTLDAGYEGHLCGRGVCNSITEGIPAFGCCLARDACGWDYGYGCTDQSIPYNPDAKEYRLPVDCNLQGRTFPCHPWTNVGCEMGNTICIPAGANEESIACVQDSGPILDDTPCTMGEPGRCPVGAGCSPRLLRCRQFCCDNWLCPPGSRCKDMDPSTPSPFGYCEAE